MKVLLINKYLYHRGGAEKSMFLTADLLREKGHEVAFWGMTHPDNASFPYKEDFVSYTDYADLPSFLKKIRASLRMLYSFEAKKKLGRVLDSFKPDVVHLNNVAHQLSPSILHVLNKNKIPTVMTLRDYKIVCPVYTLFTNNHICEQCTKGRYFHCVVNRCMKNSYAKSILSANEMYLHHKIMHMYNLIDIFISPSRFLMTKVTEMGFNGNIVFLPNFIDSKEYTPGSYPSEKVITYAGRLSSEKGILTLLKAVKNLDVTLNILGTGPIEQSLKQYADKNELFNVTFSGYKTGTALKKEMKRSMAVIVPSEWYENNPRSVLEAFALGKPVIGARIGGIPELVKDGKTGLLFESGNAADLNEKIKKVINDSDYCMKMGDTARKLIEQEYTLDKHYEELQTIYTKAITKKRTSNILRTRR